ncbi:MAG: caspase family protein [Saprospiraceae bacterium]|nr:caspase family protein [Saprospiraceae bacterium]
MPEESKKTTIHALVIGINDYQENILLSGNLIFPRLSGCVNDAKNVVSYLQSDPSLDLRLLELYDAQATKPVIVHAMRTHLAQAAAGDVVFLYYSGHGAVEKADESVWGDPRIEALVCHYDHPHSPDFLLADKELRILLKELYDTTQAHIVTIFDCCHSGDNTRELSILGGKRVKKQIDHLFPQRQWNEFIFADRFQAAQFAGKNMNEVIAQAPHVQIAAAERDEPALEVNGQGVLTFHLLKTLKSCAGSLSYRDLHSRVRNQLKYLFIQKPKIYAPEPNLDLLDAGFLKKAVEPAAKTANLVFNQKVGWRIDRGILHGVTEGVTEVMIDKNGEIFRFPVGKTELDAALVPDLTGLEKIEYLVKLSGIATQIIRLHLINKDALTNDFQSVAAALSAPENAAFIALEDDASRADYSIVFWKDMVYLTKPGDLLRPLFRPIHFTFFDNEGTAANNPGAIPELIESLRKVSIWTKLNRLQNEGSEVLDDQALEISFLRMNPDGTETPMSFDQNQICKIVYDELIGSSTRWGGQFKIVMKNKTPGTKLYVALLYQAGDFSTTARLLEPQVAEIEPGRSKTVRDHRNGSMFISLDEIAYWYNKPTFTDTLKFIVSTQPFELDGLETNGLLEPLTPDNIENEISKGGIDLDDGQGKKPSLKGWNAQTFHLEFQNPEYNAVPAKDVERMLDANSELAHFAIGLYFQKGKNGSLDASLDLASKELPAGEKGLLWNTALASANRWAHFWRMRRYKSMMQKNPDLPRLVAEGDSWFQHPLLTDIIDYVGRYYPIYCVAEAGDTIRNYLKEGEYLQAINTVDPKVFLISGGGNDILGESMVKFLRRDFEEGEEGKKPARFFTAAFKNELESVLEMYRTIFMDLQKRKPGMKIFVHGYDYPHPLASGTKKRSWIGKYLDDCEITREGDRRSAVQYMMNEFNERLKALTASEEFRQQVDYIDLRKIVRDDQWDDEIHPNDEGFQDVSLKVLQKLVEVL